jgi:uncharacterized iron-regulated membrane protein
MNIGNVRKFHRVVAPIMVMPLFVTIATGVGFQTAIALGQGNNFLWLLDLHRGKFGRINLEMIYPFLNGLGLLCLVISGLLIWLKIPKSARS